MAYFLWRAQHHQRPIEGLEQAPNGWLLRYLLKQRGIEVTACYRLWPWQRKSSLPRAKVRLQLLQQWHRLVAAQLPLLEVVRLAVPANAGVSLRWQLWRLQQLLQQGKTLAQALTHVTLFTDVEVALLAAAEEGGYLASMLSSLVDQERARQSIIKQLKRSLLMPTITLLVGVIVAMLLLFWLVPNMAGMLANQAELPVITARLLALSLWLQQWGYHLLLGGLVLMLLIWLGVKSPLVAPKLYTGISQLPVVGRVLVLQQQWQLYHLLSTGLEGGITLLRCLKLFLPSCQLLRFRQRIYRLENHLLAGETLPAAFAQAGFSEQQVIMLNMAQRTGQLGQVCGHIAKDIDSQIKERLGLLQSLIEPTITLLLAVMVGGLVLAIYLPLLQLGTMLG